MKKLAIVGAGDLGQQLAWLAESDNLFEIAGYFDDYLEKDRLVGKHAILGRIDTIEAVFTAGTFDELLIGLGYKHLLFKKELFERLKGTVKFATLIHSSCTIDASSRIGAGSVLYPGSIIDQRVKVEENTLLNLGCCIAHDSIIQSHSFYSPRVSVAGFTSIGQMCFIGIGSTIIDNITISDQVQLGAGSVVIKNIQEKGLYAGNPIKLIKKH